MFLTFHRFGGKVGPHSDALHIQVHPSSHDNASLMASVKNNITQALLAFYTPKANDALLQNALGDDYQQLLTLLPEQTHGSLIMLVLQQHLSPQLLQRIEARLEAFTCEACWVFVQEHAHAHSPHFQNTKPLHFNAPQFQALCRLLEQKPLALFRVIIENYQRLNPVQYTVLGIGANRDGQLPDSCRRHMVDVVRLEHKAMGIQFRQLCEHRQGALESKMNALRGIPIGMKNMVMGETQRALNDRTYQLKSRSGLLGKALYH